jgi:hypothetical protein
LKTSAAKCESCGSATRSPSSAEGRLRVDYVESTDVMIRQVDHAMLSIERFHPATSS